MSSNPTILFAISDTGGGHRSGAVAIEAALEQLISTSVDRYIVDMLTSTELPVVRDAPNLYDQLSTRWLPVFDFMYRLTNGPRRMNMLTRMVYLPAHRNIVRVLEETRPNLVVSVHPLVNRLIGNARRTYRLSSFRFVTVVTDLVSLHAGWADSDAELCIVPTNEAYERLLTYGVPPSKLVRTGFPVHPKFATFQDSQAMARKRLGIATDRFTLLVTGGGVGSGKLHELVQLLAKTYPQHQLLVVTGKNAALRTALQALDLGPHVQLYGFVSNMEELMAASDIVVTKAGPGTLMEALVMRRPVIVTEAVGIQEHGNIDFILNHELGAFCPAPEQVIPAVNELMDPDTYAAMQVRLNDAVPRVGASQIADLLLEQLQLAPPAPRRRIHLPSIADLRMFSARRLRLHTPPVPHLRLRLTTRRLSLPHLHWPARWRRASRR